MDYQVLARELVEAVRQEHSYLELSNKMKFSYDKVGKWVRGSREIDWDEFIEFCKIVRAPLPETLAAAIHFDQPLQPTHNLINFIIGKYKPKEAADRLRIHTSRLRRLINGSTITLAEQLQMIDEFYPQRLRIIVEKLANDYYHRITCFEDHRTFTQHYLQLFRRDPRFAVIIKLAATDEYKSMTVHTSGYFAQKMNISLAAEDQMLKELVQRGLMVFNNAHYTPIDFQLGSLTIAEQDEIIKAFLHLAYQGFPERTEKDAQNVYSAMDLLVSEDCFQKIITLFQNCFYQARQMAQEDKGTKNNWRLINLQIFEPTNVLKRLKS